MTNVPQPKSPHLTGEEVAHVAHLARLSVEEEELDRYAGELSAILGYVQQLSQMDTDNVEPVAQVTGLTNVLQADVPNSDAVSTEDFLRNAPAAEPPYIKVKAVLE